MFWSGTRRRKHVTKGFFQKPLFGDPELITRGHFCHMVIFISKRRAWFRAQTPKEGISKKESRFAAIYGF